MQDNEDGLFYKIFLRKWHPQPTITCAMVIFLSVGLIFIVLGSVIMAINASIVEHHIANYDKLGNCKENGYNKECQFTVSIPSMVAPVFFFYEISNFYQNHRRYVKSKSNNQLADISISTDEANKFCSPVIYNSDLFEYQRKYYINKKNEKTLRPSPLNEDDLANPCGLIAKSFFNDTYVMYHGNDLKEDSKVELLETGLTWSNDVGQKFKSGDEEKQWINPENEHFIIWMRTAGLPEFRKLWGRIEKNIESNQKIDNNYYEEGNYTFKVENNYNPGTFEGTKDLILSESGVFGGKNEFLGIAYLVGGSLCILIAFFFWIQGKYGGQNYGRKID